MISLSRRSDLPFKNDVTSRFLPWLIAPMVFLCIIALMSAFILGALISRWDRDVSGTLTVEIAAAPGVAGESTEKTRQWVDNAVHLLSETPGVLQVHALTQDQLVALLAPWLGNSDLLRELPLPALVDVSVDPDANVDLDALSKKLAEKIPGSSLDDHRVWLSRLISLSRTIEGLSIAVVLIIGGATAVTVIYATKTGMAVHHEAIEVLHLIGAPDDYIARQFASHAFLLSFRGALFGLLATLPISFVALRSAHKLQGGFLSDLSLPVIGWLVILVLPILVALLALGTARLTVHQALARMP